MVKEGNVRLDISIDAEVERELRRYLAANGRAKKGAVSLAVEEALKAWLEEVAKDDGPSIVSMDMPARESKVSKRGIYLGPFNSEGGAR